MITHENDHPFIGGIQTAEDRKLKINGLNATQIQAVLQRTDLQASVRNHAEKRLKRLGEVAK